MVVAPIRIPRASTTSVRTVIHSSFNLPSPPMCNRPSAPLGQAIWSAFSPALLVTLQGYMAPKTTLARRKPNDSISPAAAADVDNGQPCMRCASVVQGRTRTRVGEARATSLVRVKVKFTVNIAVCENFGDEYGNCDREFLLARVELFFRVRVTDFIDGLCGLSFSDCGRSEPGFVL